MLAFMPQASPLPAGRQSPGPASTMSLAILPSAPIHHTDASTSAPPPPPRPAVSKRPKLTLNTTQTPTLLGGKGSTSLRLDTLSAVSPTARNTFSNAYETPPSRLSASKPQRPSLTPLATNVSSVSPGHASPADEESSAVIDTPELTSSSSASTVDSLPGHVPYTLGYNSQSILCNGPIPKSKRKRTCFTQSQSMFPTQKRVAFKAPLTEEIKTTKYTMAHADLVSASPTNSTLDLPQARYPKADMHPKGMVKGEHREPEATASPRAGDKRSSDEEDSDTCPATPVAGRRKKDRQWRWTLGPIRSTQPDVEDEKKQKRDSFAESEDDELEDS